MLTSGQRYRNMERVAQKAIPLLAFGRNVSQNKVNDYVRAVEEPRVFNPVEGFDVMGK